MKGGTQQISQLILNDLLAPELRPSLLQPSDKGNQKVTVTYWDSTKVIGMDTTNETFCQVTYQQNRSPNSSNTILTRRVIVALSPTLVARNIHFNPSLPSQKQLLFDAFSMGMCVKIIVVYIEAFWEHQSSCNSELHHSMLSSFYAHNIFSTTVGDCPGLVLLVTGDAAKRLSELDHLTRQDAIFRQLIALYAPADELGQPNNHRNGNMSFEDYVRHPVQFAEKNWCQDEHSGGCFAGILGPQALTKFGNELRRSENCSLELNDSGLQRVYWASTEMATEYYGYMEGVTILAIGLFNSFRGIFIYLFLKF